MSWYPKVVLAEGEIKYIKLLQKTFKVQDTTRQWVPYKLSTHQLEWHRDDIAVQGYNAKSRVVIKSRNTSFTTSALISNIAAVPFYPDQIVPFVRLNQQRANDLISDCKKYIRHITPIRLPDKSLFPFNPNDVNLDAAGTIKFPNGVEFRAFPATASSSEIIRGLRISGSAGIVDESNFMRDYQNIFVALSDATAGEDREGKSHFQMNIGTTLKGKGTPFNLWYEREKKLPTSDIRIYSWPVFDPLKIDYSIPLTSQDIDTIVHWHSIEKLENRRLRDINKFKEEYMCCPVDSEEQFYSSELVLDRVNTELINHPTCVEDGVYFMGIDVASIQDFFAISIFQKIEDKYIQRHLFYRRQVGLPDMEKHTIKLIQIWKPIRVRVDANGIGMQLSQELQRRFGGVINPIRGSKLKGIEKNQKLPVNEYIHTNQKTLMSMKKVELINDEMQIIHYSVWDYDYKADSTEEYGHGDITIANGLALLPLNYKAIKKGTKVITNLGNSYDKTVNIPHIEQEIDWGKEDE